MTDILNAEFGASRTLPPLNSLKARSTVAAMLSIAALVSPLLGGGVGAVLTEVVTNGDAIQNETEWAVNAVNALLGVGMMT
jgi:hypothetical protein